jgi:23S rRNA pseudouridine1911/1915/1917 synthase
MQDRSLEFVVENAGERLDKLVVAQVEALGLSRAQVQALIRDGRVTVDGQQVKPGIKLRGGETITVTIPPVAHDDTVKPEPIALNVVYEDDDLAVIDKPAGLVVHPGVRNETGTLVNALLARWPQISEIRVSEKRRGIVHRLDKDTSGLMVIAKNDRALMALMRQFQARTVDKIYVALLEKAPKTRTGRIEAPIGRDHRQRKRMAVQREGKPAATEFRVLDDAFPDEHALVEFRLLTGRTHQIRVHAAFIGCPIVGDRVYGYRRQRVALKRHFLHAQRLEIDQPTTGARLHFESPLPPELEDLVAALKRAV